MIADDDERIENVLPVMTVERSQTITIMYNNINTKLKNNSMTIYYVYAKEKWSKYSSLYFKYALQTNISIVQ